MLQQKQSVCFLKLSLGFKNVKKNWKKLIIVIVKVIGLWMFLLFSQFVSTTRLFL